MNRTEQLLGKSNKFFYYHMSQGASFDIRYTITINNLNLEVLKASVAEALKRYPELAATTVIKNNNFTSLINDRPVLFVPRDDVVRHFSTDETNGYLLYFGYTDNEFTMYYYHGLTDIVGMMSFIRCYLYIYGEKTGFSFTEDEKKEISGMIREDETVFSCGDQLALLDPYGTYGDSSAVPDYEAETLGAYTLPTSDYPEEADYFHETVVTISASAFISKTKELGVSVIPLLHDIVGEAMCSAFDTGDMPLVSMVPVNLRTPFDSSTIVNCSDGVSIPFYARDMELPIEERCQKWKGYLKKQMNEGLYKKIMGNKAGAVDSYEADSTPVVEQARAKTKLPPAGMIRPVSHGLTYPGRLDFKGGLDRMIDGLDFHGLGRGTSLVIYTYGDVMKIQIVYRSDSNILSNAIISKLEDYGFKTQVSDKGRVYPNRMDVDRLEVVE